MKAIRGWIGGFLVASMAVALLAQQPVTISSGSVTANAGTNLNTSALATSANQTNASQKTQIVDGSGNIIAATSNNLNVQCANCSGSGASAADEASMTEGTSTFAPVGGYYKASITALTTGQQGMVALTPSRSFHVALYDAAGNALLGSKTSANSVPVVIASDQGAVPVSGTFWQATQPVSGTVTANQGGTWTVQPGNTANTTAWKVDGSAVTQPVSGTVTTSPPSNASTNVAQLAGTTTSVNSGNKDAGTLRVVIATDQPALTNKLLVTPDSVALPANQSVNVSQVNGVTVLTGVGASGAGAQRVVDVASGSTGAAPPAQASYVGALQSGATGGFLAGITACDLSKPINVSTATTTLMVTGVSGRQVRICSFHMVTAAANNVAWLEGTGATCGTGTAGMAGGTTAASGYNFAANGGIALGAGLGEVLTTATTGDSVCLITSAATQLSGFIKYTIY